MREDVIIGIDPGVKTGFAQWKPSKGKFILIRTMQIHTAIEYILALVLGFNVYVIVEDARKRKWYGSNSNAKIQGAGSVKRDCKIWEDFLSELYQRNIIKGFKMVHPLKGSTKLDKDTFQKITGYVGQTSEHSRDAAMLVFKRSSNDFKTF